MLRKRKRRKAPKKPQPKQPKQRFTLRQLRYKKNRLAGMSQYDAAIAAGYSHNYARASTKVEKLVKGSIIDELNRAGGTDLWLAKALVQLAQEATRLQSCTVLVQHQGKKKPQVTEDKVEVPDLWLRRACLETIAKIKRHISTQPILDASKHRHFTVVVQSEPEENSRAGLSDGSRRDQDNADSETEQSVQPADQP